MRHIKEDIFRNIYDKNFNNLVIYSVGMGVPFEQAKDLVQECFIRLWEHFPEIGSYVPYLFKSVRNSSLSFIASVENKRNSLTVSLGDISHSTHHEDTGYTAEYFQRLEEAYGRLMSLTGRCRDAFTMVYMHKMKIRDVASELEVSENTIKTYLKRAKETLKEK